MTQTESRVRAPSARWWLLTAVALAAGVALGLPVGRLGRPHPSGTTPPAAAAKADPFVLSDWQYPGAKSLSATSGGSVGGRRPDGTSAQVFLPELYASSTPDSIDLVWAHYTRLAGAEEKQLKPGGGGGFSRFTASPAGEDASGSFASYTGARDRKAVRSATIVIYRRGFTVAAHVSRGQEDDGTYIDMAVQRAPVQSAP